MTSATATLNGKTITKATVTLPVWGVWHADVEVADDEVQTGPAKLVIEDLSLTGTIVPGRGGVFAAKGKYRVLGGAGGWGTQQLGQGYRNDAGIEIQTLLKDVEALSKETLGGVYPSGSVGARFTRLKGPCSYVLQYVSLRRWYVNEAGVTVIGARPSTVLSPPWTLIDYSPEHARFTLAAELISDILPGTSITDVDFGAGVTLVAGDVTHVLDANKLRTIVQVAPTEAA